MELRQFEYFIAVCEELHFTKAAEKLGISQPNLSLQIRAMEEELGTPLFDRIGKRIALTEAGSILLKHSRGMFQNLENAFQEIGELRDHQGGNLAVGVLPSELDYRLTPLFIGFHHQFPKVRLKIFSSVEIEKLVLETDVDIGITMITSSDNRLVVLPLSKEEYGLVVSTHHELAELTSVSLTDLKEIPMIMYPKGFIGRELVENCCKEYGFQLNTIVETTSNPSLFHFVRENIGGTIQTHSLVNSISDPHLRFIPINDRPPVRQMGILYRADKYLGHTAHNFIQAVQHQLKAQ